MDENENIYDLLMSGGDIRCVDEAPRIDGRRLGSHEPGDIVTIGERQYIVLEHSGEATAVISKDIVVYMEFGNDGDYRHSSLREWLNSAFYGELVQAVGNDGVLPSLVNLMADDGTGAGIVVEDKVTVLTTQMYREYRKFLPKIGKWWWTATRVSHDESD